MEKTYGKVAKAGVFSTVREIIHFLNNKKIPKDDIVSIIKENEMIVVIYYGAE